MCKPGGPQQINPTSQGRLNSIEFADHDSVFYIGVNHAEKVTEEIRHMVSSSNIYRQMHASLNLVNMNVLLINTQTYFKRIN